MDRDTTAQFPSISNALHNKRTARNQPLSHESKLMYLSRFIMRLLLAIISGLIMLTIAVGVLARPPDTVLERLNGGREPMSQYIGQGQWVVVNVWSPSCSACVEELPDVIQFHENHPDIPVIGITIDFPSFEYGKPDIINDFLKQQPLDYPLFLADRELASELIGKELIAIPLIAIFHPDGHAVARWPGRINPGEIETFIDNYDSYKLNNDRLGDF